MVDEKLVLFYKPTPKACADCHGVNIPKVLPGVSAQLYSPSAKKSGHFGSIREQNEIAGVEFNSVPDIRGAAGKIGSASSNIHEQPAEFLLPWKSFNVETAVPGLGRVGKEDSSFWLPRGIEGRFPGKTRLKQQITSAQAPS